MKFSIFVCGTPSNKEGFKYKILNGVPLPGTPSRYIDKFDPTSMSKGSTYIIQNIDIDYKNYSLLIEYRQITPNDQRSSRGAYIAVGILVSNQIDINSSIIYYQMIAEVHAHLLAYRNKNNAFTSSFDLERYMYKPLELTLDASYLVDTLCKASSKDNKLFKSGAKIIYNDVSFSDKMISSKGFYYISDKTDEINKIKSLEQELIKEKKRIIELEKLYHIEKERYKDLGNKYNFEKQQSIQNQNSKQYQNSRQNNHYQVEHNDQRRDTQKDKGFSIRKERVYQEEDDGINIIHYLLIALLILSLFIGVYFIFSDSEPEIIVIDSKPISKPKKFLEEKKEEPKRESTIDKFNYEADVDSKFYKRPYNVFAHKYAKSDMWYVYGRILELVDSDELNTYIKNRVIESLGKKREIPRFSKNWSKLLNIQEIPKNKIKKGSLAIWYCMKNGHIGFVEGVDSQGNYFLSDYNRDGDSQYNYKQYNKLSDDKDDECAPKFYDLSGV